MKIISVNIVAVLVLLYSSCIVFNNTANVKNNTTKVANYYKYTNLAEREIINNNFSATKYYNLAFEGKFPFRSDLKWAKTSFVLSGEHNLNIIYKFLRYNKMLSSSSGSETIKFFKEE